MSWSVSLPNPVSVADLPIALDTAINAAKELNPTVFAEPGVDEQVNVAFDAALDIVGSGAIGNNDKSVRVSINGHANSDHEPRTGWVNDTITVTVSQA